ncbi:hypothetical protein KCP70_18875 [Salmonella enterica subsp. enterica]|nr:hypothetical protein KCP70_18875 [Salmonella enterica subsp. enterica]
MQMPRGIPVGTLAIGASVRLMPPLPPRRFWRNTTRECTRIAARRKAQTDEVF